MSAYRAILSLCLVSVLLTAVSVGASTAGLGMKVIGTKYTVQGLLLDLEFMNSNAQSVDGVAIKVACQASSGVVLVRYAILSSETGLGQARIVAASTGAKITLIPLGFPGGKRTVVAPIVQFGTPLKANGCADATAQGFW